MRRRLLIGALSAATTIGGWPVAGATPPIVKDGVSVTVLSRAASHSLVRVELDVEPLDASATRALRFGSMRSSVEIDCRQGKNRMLRAEAFEAAKLKGESQPRELADHWVLPSADSYMRAVTETVCKGQSPSEPPTQAAAARGEPASSSSPAPTAPLAASRLPARGKPVMAAVAQVAASPTAEGAQKALAGLGGRIKPPLSGTVASVEVNGARLYRALVVGFADSAAARSFCAALSGAGKACWAHAAEVAPTALAVSGARPVAAAAEAAPPASRPAPPAPAAAPPPRIALAPGAPPAPSAAAPSAGADFWFLGAAGNRTVYVYANARTVTRRVDGGVSAWFTWVLEGPKVLEANAKREDFQLTFDCDAHQNKMTDLVVYDRRGNVTKSGTTPVQSWSPDSPGSISAMEEAFACTTQAVWERDYAQVNADPVANADSLFSGALVLRSERH